MLALGNPNEETQIENGEAKFTTTVYDQGAPFVKQNYDWSFLKNPFDSAVKNIQTSNQAWNNEVDQYVLKNSLNKYLNPFQGMENFIGKVWKSGSSAIGSASQGVIAGAGGLLLLVAGLTIVGTLLPSKKGKRR